MRLAMVPILILALLASRAGSGKAQAHWTTDLDKARRWLNDPKDRVQAGALKSLRDLGPEARRTADAIGRVLSSSKDRHVRLLAIQRLEEFAQAFGKVPPMARGAVSQALTDPDSAIQLRAINLTGALGYSCALDTLNLMTLMRSKNKQVRLRAIWAVGKFGVGAKPAISYLVKALKEGDYPNDFREVSIPSSAAKALSEIGPTATPAIPALLEAIRLQDLSTRRIAVHALGRIGPRDPRVIPTLIDLLTDQKDPIMCSSAASALGRIGPEAKEAIPALIKMLNLQGEESGPPKSWRIPYVSVVTNARSLAAEALGRMGPAAKVALPALLKVLKDEDASDAVRQKVAYALGDLGPVAKEALPALFAILADHRANSSSIRGAIQHSLICLGPDAVPFLIEKAKKGPENSRIAAINALRQMGLMGRDAIGVLETIVRDERGRIAVEARSVLSVLRGGR